MISSSSSSSKSNWTHGSVCAAGPVVHLHVVLVLFAGVRGVHVHVFGGEDVLELHDLPVANSLPVLPGLLRQVVLVLRLRCHL